jgi:hypothetical protein
MSYKIIILESTKDNGVGEQKRNLHEATFGDNSLRSFARNWKHFGWKRIMDIIKNPDSDSKLSRKEVIDMLYPDAKIEKQIDGYTSLDAEVKKELMFKEATDDEVYDDIVESDKTKRREKAIAEAKELGIIFPKNIKTETLEEKIKENIEN